MGSCWSTQNSKEYRQYFGTGLRLRVLAVLAVFRGSVQRILYVVQAFRGPILRILRYSQYSYCSYSQYSQYSGLRYCSYSQYSQYSGLQYCSYSQYTQCEMYSILRAYSRYEVYWEHLCKVRFAQTEAGFHAHPSTLTVWGRGACNTRAAIERTSNKQQTRRQIKSQGICTSIFYVNIYI